MPGHWPSPTPYGAAPSGRRPSTGTSSSDLASTLPYLMGILGPPQASMDAALAIWIRSAWEISGYFSLRGASRATAAPKPAFPPCASSLSNLMLATAPPFLAARS